MTEGLRAMLEPDHEVVDVVRDGMHVVAPQKCVADIIVSWHEYNDSAVEMLAGILGQLGPGEEEGSADPLAVQKDRIVPLVLAPGCGFT